MTYLDNLVILCGVRPKPNGLTDYVRASKLLRILSWYSISMKDMKGLMDRMNAGECVLTIPRPTYLANRKAMDEAFKVARICQRPRPGDID